MPCSYSFSDHLVSAVSQNQPLKVEIKDFKTSHFLDQKTAPQDRPDAGPMGGMSNVLKVILQATISRQRLVPGGGSPASLGSIERQLVGICCWQNQPFRPPAKALGERANANPWPKRPHGR
jgi:hypothetical protein